MTASDIESPTNRAPAKRATPTGKKAPAKKATAAETASVTKKPPAKTAPVTKKAPAKKAPAAKKAPVTKASRLSAAKKLASGPMAKYFSKARDRATKMLDDPEALRRVAEESHRSGALRSGPFAAVMGEFRTLVRLVVAYSRGNYRDIPSDSLAIIVGGLLYVLSPLDLIPDFLPGGFVDDAVIVGLVIKSVREEIDAFSAWEVGESDSPGTDNLPSAVR